MPFFPPTPKPPRNLATHLTFWVHDSLYALPLPLLVEVTAWRPFAPLVSTDKAVVGEMGWREGALLVVDLGLRFQGRALTPGPKSCILVIRRQQARCGCLCSGLAEPTDLSACLVERAEAPLAPGPGSQPENPSGSGAAYGFPLCRWQGRELLLPPTELFYPQ